MLMITTYKHLKEIMGVLKKKTFKNILILEYS